MSFAELGVDEALAKALLTAFNIDKASNIQEKVITRWADVDQVRDVLIRSKTGSGKTLAFLVPIINRLLIERRAKVNMEKDCSRSMGTVALIIVPTRELASQTQETLTKLLSKLHGRDHWLVSSSLSGGDRRKSEKERLRKGVHIVVGTPGRILDHLRNTESWSKQIGSCRWIILDEADRLLDCGFEKFVREIIETIVKTKDRQPPAQMILCSATVDENRKEVFGCPLRDPLFITENRPESQDGSSSKDNRIPLPSRLEHFYLCTPTKFRLATLLGLVDELLCERASQKLVLFTICRDTVDFLYALLRDERLNLLSSAIHMYKLHGDLEHKRRIETFSTFVKQQESCLLICTDIAARGLNLCNVACIIQYDAPCDINDYIHRAGRTARQEKQGKSILFLMPTEREYLNMLQEKGLGIKPVPWESLAERFIKKIDLKPGKTHSSTESGEDDDDNGKNVSPDLKVRNLALIETLERSISTKNDLIRLAKTAYLSFVRAYATHPASEKSIFHIRRLHLGHLAAMFLLSEAPASVASNYASKDSRNRVVCNGTFEKTEGKKMMTRPKRARVFSEFDAGDITASFMQPRANVTDQGKK